MAICKWCDKDMAKPDVLTCSGNKSVDFWDMSQEFVTAFPDKSMQPIPWNSAGRCPDCYVAPGGNHHPGCDQERCPACSKQLVSCGCLAKIVVKANKAEEQEVEDLARRLGVRPLLNALAKALRRAHGAGESFPLEGSLSSSLMS